MHQTNSQNKQQQKRMRSTGLELQGICNPLLGGYEKRSLLRLGQLVSCVEAGGLKIKRLRPLGRPRTFRWGFRFRTLTQVVFGGRFRKQICWKKTWEESRNEKQNTCWYKQNNPSLLNKPKIVGIEWGNNHLEILNLISLQWLNSSRWFHWKEFCRNQGLVNDGGPVVAMEAAGESTTDLERGLRGHEAGAMSCQVTWFFWSN